jgi:hypothetical protein
LWSGPPLGMRPRVGKRLGLKLRSPLMKRPLPFAVRRAVAADV